MNDGRTYHSSPAQALDELSSMRIELRRKISEYLSELDPTDPDTLKFAVTAMFEAHFDAKELSNILGPSRTTITRWAEGHTIPRSPPYRKWLVDTLSAHLADESAGQAAKEASVDANIHAVARNSSARISRSARSAGGGPSRPVDTGVRRRGAKIGKEL